MEKYEEKYYVTIRCNDEQAAQELISKAESVGIKAYIEGDTKVFAEGDAVHKEAFIEAVKSEYDIDMSDDKLKFSHLFSCNEQTALAIIQEAKKSRSCSEWRRNKRKQILCWY